MAKANLNRGDIRRIAESLGICHETIRSINNGRRGKRGTELQESVKQAIQLRAEQNQRLELFCKAVAVKKVLPTKNK